ncbi:flavin reductase family protein [Mycobacterium sp. 21AC1]|nr:flavin reductase family protein [Mycobacterium sp. 21AC1]
MPTVLVATSFAVGVSQDPPLVSFAIQRTSATWPVLSGAPTIGISVLGEVHAHKVRQLGSKKQQQRLDGLEIWAEPSGALFLDGAPVWLECSVEHTYPAGDHHLVVLRVLATASNSGSIAVVWHESGCASLIASGAGSQR